MTVYESARAVRANGVTVGRDALYVREYSPAQTAGVTCVSFTPRR